MTARFDILIIGAGIAGASVAYELAVDAKVAILAAEYLVEATGYTHMFLFLAAVSGIGLIVCQASASGGNGLDAKLREI